MFSRKVLLNTLCEFGPVTAFMVAYTIADFQMGTVAMMVAVVIALVVLQATEHHLPIFALISAATVLVFGGISLFIEIPSIFILRDTIFDSIFGIVLVISVYMKRPALKYIFKNVFAITDRGWSVLTLRWGFFFFVLALVNEGIRWTLTPDDWVLAKVYMIVGTVIFGMYQFTLTKKERLPDATEWGIGR